jgi:hypothetical protein
VDDPRDAEIAGFEELGERRHVPAAGFAQGPRRIVIRGQGFAVLYQIEPHLRSSKLSAQVPILALHPVRRPDGGRDLVSRATKDNVIKVYV